MTGAPSFLGNILWLTFFGIALVEPLDTAGGIHHAPLAGEERVAIAAYFHPEFLFRGTGGELVAAGTGDDGIFIILGMNFFFHIFQLA